MKNIITLRIFSGVHLGAEINLPLGTFVLGNDDSCDIILQDPSLASRHIQLLVALTSEAQNDYEKQKDTQNTLPKALQPTQEEALTTLSLEPNTDTNTKDSKTEDSETQNQYTGNSLILNNFDVSDSEILVTILPLDGNILINNEKFTKSTQVPARTPAYIGQTCFAWTEANAFDYTWSSVTEQLAKRLDNTHKATLQNDTNEQTNNEIGTNEANINTNEQTHSQVATMPDGNIHTVNTTGNKIDSANSIDKLSGELVAKTPELIPLHGKTKSEKNRRRAILFFLLLCIIALSITVHDTYSILFKNAQTIEDILKNTKFSHLIVTENEYGVTLHGSLKDDIERTELIRLAQNMHFSVYLDITVHDDFINALQTAYHSQGFYPEILTLKQMLLKVEALSKAQREKTNVEQAQALQNDSFSAHNAQHIMLSQKENVQNVDILQSNRDRTDTTLLHNTKQFIPPVSIRTAHQTQISHEDSPLYSNKLATKEECEIDKLQNRASFDTAHTLALVDTNTLTENERQAYFIAEESREVKNTIQNLFPNDSIELQVFLDKSIQQTKDLQNLQIAEKKHPKLDSKLASKLDLYIAEEECEIVNTIQNIFPDVQSIAFQATLNTLDSLAMNQEHAPINMQQSMQPVTDNLTTHSKTSTQQLDNQELHLLAKNDLANTPYPKKANSIPSDKIDNSTISRAPLSTNTEKHFLEDIFVYTAFATEQNSEVEIENKQTQKNTPNNTQILVEEEMQASQEALQTSQEEMQKNSTSTSDNNSIFTVNEDILDTVIENEISKDASDQIIHVSGYLKDGVMLHFVNMYAKNNLPSLANYTVSYKIVNAEEVQQILMPLLMQMKLNHVEVTFHAGSIGISGAINQSQKQRLNAILNETSRILEVPLHVKIRITTSSGIIIQEIMQYTGIDAPNAITYADLLATYPPTNTPWDAQNTDHDYAHGVRSDGTAVSFGTNIIGYTEDGKPIYASDPTSNNATGRHIIGYTADGTPIYSDTIIGYTEDGKPIYANLNTQNSLQTNTQALDSDTTEGLVYTNAQGVISRNLNGTASEIGNINPLTGEFINTSQSQKMDNSESNFSSQPAQYMFEVSSIMLEPLKFITLTTGERIFEGGLLPGMYILEQITLKELILKKDGLISVYTLK